MQVFVIKNPHKQSVSARIILPKTTTLLPSLTEGWRFNFRSNTRKEKLETYILTTDETPEIIEGCLCFKLRDRTEPYMAYIELAPHNQGKNRAYDNVAGCLIAFACRLSFKYGEGPYKGWLAFDVLEEDEVAERKLMAVYSSKYGAVRFCQTTTMIISPEAGEKLIQLYLKK